MGTAAGHQTIGLSLKVGFLFEQEQKETVGEGGVGRGAHQLSSLV